jgi:Protein of unknown function (DUF2478)
MQGCNATPEETMDARVERIGVVRGASGAQVQDMFRSLAQRWRGSVRLAGLIAEDHGLADRACSAGFLRNIATGERFSIFHDLGPGSTVCHLDGVGALTAAQSIQRDITAGCELVLLNKFGKLEADGTGLFAAFGAALDAGIPLLTSVSSAFEPAWTRLTGRSFCVLRADMDEIGTWWGTIRNTAMPVDASASPRGAAISRSGA